MSIRDVYKVQQFLIFGCDYEENLVWDGYIHGESIESEDILMGEYNE